MMNERHNREMFGRNGYRTIQSDKVGRITQDAGLDKSTVFWPTADIDDSQVMKLVRIVYGNLGILFS